jgi:hypothetical protein
MEEQFDMVSSESTIQFVPRITGFNGVDVATKADGDAPAFETDVYTAYLLIFDNNGNRVYFASVDENNGSWSQKVTMTNLTSGTACFIANVPQTFAEGIATITDLNSAVLTLTYATYSEAGGYLGVPKLSVNGEYKLCLPMFGSTQISNMTHNQTCRIDIKRLFAKVSVNLKMKLTNVGIGQIAPTTVNYELDQYFLYNLPTKVSLVPHVDGDETESGWVKDKTSFTGSETVPISSDNGLGWQTININDSDSNSDNNSSSVSGIDFCFYVPEYYLNAVSNPVQDQKYKPVNYDTTNKHAIYLQLNGELNQSLIDNTTIKHKIYLGEDHIDNYTLKRNINYLNIITIKGIENNDKGEEGENLDHRVTTEIINNPVAQAGQSANCYIIGKTGEYTIPAFKGAYSNLSDAPLCLADKQYVDTRVYVPFNKSQSSGIDEIPFEVNPTYDPETNTISFTIDKIDASILGSLDYVPNGNVILELQYKESEEGPWITEWSWHLWCLTNVNILGTGWGQVGEETMPDGKNKLHDRNIGVVSGTPIGAQTGFYYKYGEHIPYADTNNDEICEKLGGGTLASSTWKLDNGGKSPTDPCPPGYRVPTSDLWTKVNDTGATKEHSLIGINKYAYRYYNNSLYFPYAGWFDGDLELQSGVQGDNPNESTYTRTIDVKYNYTSFGTINYMSPVGTPSQFKEIKWKKVDETTEGRLWGSDEKALKYGTLYDGIKITSFKKQTGTWNRSKTRVTWNNDWDDYDDPSTLSDTEKMVLIDELDGDIWDKIDWGDISGSLQKIFNPNTPIFEFTEDADLGYQVRCILEPQKKLE